MSRNPHDEMLGSNQSKQSCTSISSNFSQQVFKKLGSKVDFTFNTIKDALVSRSQRWVLLAGLLRKPTIELHLSDLSQSEG
jgi:hypothetical protein